MNPTLVLPKGGSIVGVDMRSQDESTLCNLRIIEPVGARTCTNVSIGGTSGYLYDLWLSNSDTAIFCDNIAGLHARNITSEACNKSLSICSIKGVYNCAFSDYLAYDCKIGLFIQESGGLIQNVLFSQCAFLKAHLYDVFVDGGKGICFTGCNILDGKEGGAYIADGTVSFVNCNFHSSNGYSLRLSEESHVSIVGGQIAPVDSIVMPSTATGSFIFRGVLGLSKPGTSSDNDSE